MSVFSRLFTTMKMIVVHDGNKMEQETELQIDFYFSEELLKINHEEESATSLKKIVFVFLKSLATTKRIITLHFCFFLRKSLKHLKTKSAK